MPTNQTHEEMIKSKFIEKFRNPLRNYYTYGFMNYPSAKGCDSNFATLPGTRKTLDEDWQRLSNILRQDQYFQWSAERSKIAFISADSQSQLCNPFHRTYRFSMYTDSDLAIFFNTVLALSEKYELAEEFFSVGKSSLPAMRMITKKRNEEINSGKRTDSNGNEQSIVPLLQSFCENYAAREMTYMQISAFCESPSVDFLEEDQNVRKYLKSREKLNLISRISSDKRNIKWKLGELTIQRFIDQCDDEADLFWDAVDFFSRYAVLGEYGTYLLSRSHKEVKSKFRFKHEYFAQSLNDYIKIDLIKAIENKTWCKITQSNPITGEDKALICFPIQIRTSQISGREYLSFYSPHNHSCSSIRLDLITEILFIEDIKMNGEDITLNNPFVKEELYNSKTAILHSWGVSTTARLNNNVKVPIPLKEVRLVIQFDPEDNREYYILNRLEHEKRHGTINVQGNRIIFTIKVTDSTEMRPWIRSLFTRIVDYSGLDTDTFTLSDEAFAYKNIENEFNSLRPDTSFPDEWFIPAGTTYTSIDNSESDSLFNPYFGVYFMLFGDILSSIYQKGSRKHNCLTKNEIDECIKTCFQKRKQEVGAITINTLADTNGYYNIRFALERLHFIKCGQMNQGNWVEDIPKDKEKLTYHIKYRANPKMSTDLFNEVIPLTTWELRWLHTILLDEKMKLFLSQGTIEKLIHLIPDDIKPLPTSDIIVFDRFHSIGQKPNAEFFRIIISALHKCVPLEINYSDGKGREYEGTYCPLHIEYSKRDDRFRLYVVDTASRLVHIMNIDGINSISHFSGSFNPDEYQEILSNFLSNSNTTKEVTVEFTDTKNIPDRILNEFAPWRKKCELVDKVSKLYRLTLYYYKNDEKEILIRLMSYGPYIRIVDKEHSIYMDLMDRIEKQIELFRERGKDR